MFLGDWVIHRKTITAFSLLIATAGSLSACSLNKQPGASSTQTLETEPVQRLTTALTKDSNLTRSTVEVMGIRLRALFPGMNPEARTGAAQTLAKQLLDLTSRRGTVSKTLTTGGMRTAGLATQSEFQQFISNLCADSAAARGLLADDFSGYLLTSSESLPTDPAVHLALSVARKAWLYPYTADAQEVQLLAGLYRQALATPSTTSDAAKKLLCQAALFSPQFWIGNPGSLDIIRRVSLGLAHEIPDFLDFERVRTGQLTLAQYVERIQRDKREQYLDAVVTWHKEWIQWEDTPVSEFFASMMEPRSRKGIARHAITESYPSALAPHEMIIRMRDIRGVGVVPVIENDRSSMNFAQISDSEHCEPYAQTFDPRTSRVEWWLSSVSVRDPGAVTLTGILAGGWTKIADTSSTTASRDLARIAYNTQVGTEFRTPRRTLSTGAIVGPDVVGDVVGDQHTSRLRAIRYSATGVAQTGYSPVKLWWSGQTVYACNNLLRYLAACSFQPNWADAIESFSRSESDVWDATHTRVVYNAGVFGDDIAVNSIAHPTILGRFNCFKPRVSNRSGSLAIEFPTSGELNDLAYNAIFSVDQNFEAGTTLRTDPVLSAEYRAIRSIWEDLGKEPERLIKEVINRGDYRELLTADWTLGRGPLELYYRMQAHYLPAYPSDRTLISSDWMTERRINASSFTPLDSSWFINPGMPGTFRHWRDWTRGDLNPNNLEPMTPRPMAGILTQNAFMKSETASKTRSFANRIFTTFTCEDVGNHVLTDAEKAVNLPYVRNQESGGQHTNPTCLGCHINLDPLASALSTGFQDYVLTPEQRRSMPLPADPDLHYVYRGREDRREDPNLVNRRIDTAGELIGQVAGYNQTRTLYGIRGKASYPSNGALFGETVSGIADVGRKLSQSEEFARCSVRKAFEGIFGRAPGLADAQLLSIVIRHFMGDDRYNYDRMIQRLVTSKGFQREN